MTTPTAPTLAVAPSLIEEIFTILNLKNSPDAERYNITEDALQNALRNSFLDDQGGDHARERLATLMVELEKASAAKPEIYPGAHPRAVAERWQPFEEKVRRAHEDLLGAVASFQKYYALVPGLAGALSRFTHTLEIGWSTTGPLTPAARTRQTMRRAAAHTQLELEIIALTKSKSQTPKFLADLAKYTEEYDTALEIELSVSPNASKLAKQVFASDKAQALADLTEYLNTLIYTELTRPKLTLIGGRKNR